MSPTITHKIREIIQDTFAVEIDQKPNKIAAIQSKYKVSKDLIDKAKKKVTPIANEYLHDKIDSEKKELMKSIQHHLEKEFIEFMKREE